MKLNLRTQFSIVPKMFSHSALVTTRTYTYLYSLIFLISKWVDVKQPVSKGLSRAFKITRTNLTQ